MAFSLINSTFVITDIEISNEDLSIVKAISKYLSLSADKPDQHSVRYENETLEIFVPINKVARRLQTLAPVVAACVGECCRNLLQFLLPYIDDMLSNVEVRAEVNYKSETTLYNFRAYELFEVFSMLICDSIRANISNIIDKTLKSAFKGLNTIPTVCSHRLDIDYNIPSSSVVEYTSLFFSSKGDAVKIQDSLEAINKSVKNKVTELVGARANLLDVEHQDLFNRLGISKDFIWVTSKLTELPSKVEQASGPIIDYLAVGGNISV